MSIKYEKLFLLMETKGVNKNYLRKNGIYAATVDKLIKGGTVDTDTINKLCRILDCQPGDILEYTPDAQSQLLDKISERVITIGEQSKY